MITKLSNVKTVICLKKPWTSSQAAPQGIAMRRNNLIPSDTKILPLFLRQKGRKIKILKDRERQLPFPPREVLRKELIFPNSDIEWRRACKSAVSTTEFQERLGHGHWQRERLTRDLIKEAGRVENRESQLQNGLIIQNVVHKKIQTVHPDSALCHGAGRKGWPEYCPAYLRTLNLNGGFKTAPGLCHLPTDTSAWWNLMQIWMIREKRTLIPSMYSDTLRYIFFSQCQWMPLGSTELVK